MPDHSTQEDRPEPQFFVKAKIGLFRERPELIVFDVYSRVHSQTNPPPQWHTSIEDELSPEMLRSLFVLRADEAEQLARHFLTVAAESRNSL